MPTTVKVVELYLYEVSAANPDPKREPVLAWIGTSTNQLQDARTGFYSCIIGRRVPSYVDMFPGSTKRYYAEQSAFHNYIPYFGNLNYSKKDSGMVHKQYTVEQLTQKLSMLKGTVKISGDLMSFLDHNSVTFSTETPPELVVTRVIKPDGNVELAFRNKETWISVRTKKPLIIQGDPIGFLPTSPLEEYSVEVGADNYLTITTKTRLPIT